MFTAQYRLVKIVGSEHRADDHSVPLPLGPSISLRTGFARILTAVHWSPSLNPGGNLSRGAFSLQFRSPPAAARLRAFVDFINSPANRTSTQV
jgi:hypothetical protein